MGTPQTPPQGSRPGLSAEGYATRRERVGWYFYDWANSAFVTTILTVFLGPYLTTVTRAAADQHGYVFPLGIPVAAGSFYPYLVAMSAMLQVLFLPVLGAVADSSQVKKQMLGVFAYLGAAATAGLYFKAPVHLALLSSASPSSSLAATGSRWSRWCCSFSWGSSCSRRWISAAPRWKHGMKRLQSSECAGVPGYCIVLESRLEPVTLPPRISYRPRLPATASIPRVDGASRYTRPLVPSHALYDNRPDRPASGIAGLAETLLNISRPRTRDEEVEL